MIFADMSNFHKGREFFFLHPSHAVRFFIIFMALMILFGLIWSLLAKMDDIIKATAYLRPASVISRIITVTGGEVIEKNYTNNQTVEEGELLLRLDASADTIDYQNSQKLMIRINSDIDIAENLLQTIKTNQNHVSENSGESYIRSQIYLNEYTQMQDQIEELQKKLDREKDLPESMISVQRIEDMESEISQADLKFSLWINSKYVEAVDAIKVISGEKEALERRLSDLDRNIRNSIITSPIAGEINEIIRLNIGDYILPGERIIDIVPGDSSSLKADLYINPIYAPRVNVGQKVSLRFPGLPPSKFGKIDAEISLIPADYILTQGSDPSFVVESYIQYPYLTARNGEKVYLRPGLGAEARIIVSQGTVMSMILKKLDFISSSMDVKNEE
jgi:multidrug resistance efflux pump